MKLGWRSNLRRRRFDPMFSPFATSHHHETELSLAFGQVPLENQADPRAWECDTSGLTKLEAAKKIVHYNAQEFGLICRRILDLFKP